MVDFQNDYAQSYWIILSKLIKVPENKNKKQYTFRVNTYKSSDNFSFQKNGIKKCTCWKTMGFLEKQILFKKKAMFFTQLHT